MGFFLHLYILETTFTNDYIIRFIPSFKYIFKIVCILQFSIPIHVSVTITNNKFNCILLDILIQIKMTIF